MKRVLLPAVLALAACETTQVIAPVTEPAVAVATPEPVAGTQDAAPTSADEAAPDAPPPPQGGLIAYAGFVEMVPGGRLALPARPGFDVESSWFETVVGRYGERTQAFQASVTAGPDRMKVIMMIPSGPRFMEIEWTENGVKEKRSVFAPSDLSALNILADMYLVSGPEADVIAALQGDWRKEVDGSKETWFLDEAPVIEVNRGWPDLKGNQIIVYTNLARGYSLEIIREPSS